MEDEVSSTNCIFISVNVLIACVFGHLKLKEKKYLFLLFDKMYFISQDKGICFYLLKRTQYSLKAADTSLLAARPAYLVPSYNMWIVFLSLLEIVVRCPRSSLWEACLINDILLFIMQFFHPMVVPGITTKNIIANRNIQMWKLLLLLTEIAQKYSVTKIYQKTINLISLGNLNRLLKVARWNDILQLRKRQI